MLMMKNKTIQQLSPYRTTTWSRQAKEIVPVFLALNPTLNINCDICIKTYIQTYCAVLPMQCHRLVCWNFSYFLRISDSATQADVTSPILFKTEFSIPVRLATTTWLSLHPPPAQGIKYSYYLYNSNRKRVPVILRGSVSKFLIRRHNSRYKFEHY